DAADRCSDSRGHEDRGRTVDHLAADHSCRCGTASRSLAGTDGPGRQPAWCDGSMRWPGPVLVQGHAGRSIDRGLLSSAILAEPGTAEALNSRVRDGASCNLFLGKGSVRLIFERAHLGVDLLAFCANRESQE